MGLRGSLKLIMLSRTISEQYIDSLRSPSGRLERNGDSSEAWVAEFKLYLLKRIAELGRIDPVSVANSDRWCLTDPPRTSTGRCENQTFRKTVLLSGTLAKSGSIANCIVRATRVTVPSLQDSEYLDVDVLLAPPHLASGHYELHFEGRRMRIRNNAGRWSTSVSCEHSAIPGTVVKDGYENS